MNKFKSLLLLCMVFAFTAMSNQGFCNDDPVSVEVSTPCIGNVAVTQMCNPDGSSTVTITLSGSDGDDATATVSGGYTVSPASLGMSNGDFTLTIPAGDLPVDLDVSVNISGSTCEAASVNPTPDPTTIAACPAPSDCDNCLADMEKVINTGGTNVAGDSPDVEVCGGTTEIFEGIATMLSNGNIMTGRDVTYNAATAIDLNPGFHANAGCTFSANAGVTVTCTPFAPENNPVTSFTAPSTTVEVTIAPNPVTNIAQISYELPEEGQVQVSLFDMKGNRVSVIANGNQVSGIHTIDFDSSTLGSGFYYLTVQTASTQVTERMVIVK